MHLGLKNYIPNVLNGIGFQNLNLVCKYVIKLVYFLKFIITLFLLYYFEKKLEALSQLNISLVMLNIFLTDFWIKIKTQFLKTKCVFTNK